MKLPTPPADNRTYRVLVAEDDSIIAKLIGIHLKMAGFETEIAGNGTDAWTAFEASDPHLVLSDIQMPGLSGHELTAKIRAAGSGTPIILMTAAGSDQAEMDGFKSGADDYVSKPFNPKLLMARVVANLRRVYRYDVGAPAPNSAPEIAVAPATNSANFNFNPTTTPTSAPFSSPDAAAQHAAAAIEAMRPGGASASQSKALPEGWSECSSCGYLGPQFKFEGEDSNGEKIFICPNCNSRALTFSLG
ncbi:Response regulator receiver domain-containing protein [Abditibacterium utsteinense]|uniref:Response regulator receiver domain-containing protein n=1 Tax=Abditibacterium utsteinense TaxID=1960156 RepID=A0A2S8SVM5_9BACT|nr:response regulator transcription factor [Abditibacterium utsteinense]PQV64839.1 Response regulator receiver domain-containing protein [Abditibacterium utsteinense]